MNNATLRMSFFSKNHEFGMEKKNKLNLSYNNDKTGKGGGRAHEKSLSIN